MSGVRLSRRLTLEERASAPDGSGGHAVTWRALGVLWAEVSGRGGREDFIGQATPRVRMRILVRGAPVGAPSRPRADQRFREGMRVFDILTVAEHDATGRYLEIAAEEGVLP
ncbi:MAG: head-tail adaptor protein [Rhodobacteraceae bacterium]|nr:head-tail adaptor protein [Paracoccaceae bacterium]